MAGWFEAFANFAKAGSHGLDRYAQMREMRDDKRLKAEQRAFENQLLQSKAEREEQLARLQSEQLSNAILGQKQDTFSKYRLPGSEVNEQDMGIAQSIGLGGNISPNRPSPLMSATLRRQPNIGQSYTLGENPEDAPVPILDGMEPEQQTWYGLPDKPFTGNQWMGTPQQQLQDRQYQMQLRAMQGADINDPNSLMNMDIANGNPIDVRRYSPTQRTQPAGSEFTQFMNATPEEQQAMLQARKTWSEAGRDPSSGSGGSGNTTPAVATITGDEGDRLRNAIGRVAMSLNGPRRAGFTSTINDYISRGVPREQIVDLVRQAAIESEGMVQRDKLMARGEMRAQLANARTALQGLKAAGLPTDWLRGGVENTLRQLGTTNDPKYVTFKQQLEDAVINYRRAATGAAFTEAERSTYERMFPSVSNTGDVNEALISGLLQSSDTIERNFWDHKLGQGGYDFINGKAADQANSARSTGSGGGVPDGGTLVRDPVTRKLRMQ